METNWRGDLLGNCDAASRAPPLTPVEGKLCTKNNRIYSEYKLKKYSEDVHVHFTNNDE